VGVNMNKKQLTIMANLPTSFLMTFTASVISLNVMRSIDDVMFNVSEGIGLIFSIYIYKLLEKKDIREWCIDRGVIFAYLQVVVMATICIISYRWLEWRFFGIVVIYATLGEFMDSLITTQFNKAMSGDELTEFGLKEKRMRRVGQLGGILSVLVLLTISGEPLSFEVALYLQILSISIDAYVFSLWFKKDKFENNG